MHYRHGILNRCYSFHFFHTDTCVNKELNVGKFRQELEQFYLEDFCYVKTDPWDDTEFLLDRYFTYLSLNEEDRRSGFLRKIPLANSHNDIFDVRIDGRIPHRILVFGEGGTGKTTLCKKLAYDWAKKDPSSPLKDVPVLCVLEFRKLQGSENIENAIYNQLFSRDSAITPDQIRQFIRSSPSKIVIVLDGYDEYDPKTKGDINDLLNTKIMAKVRVMVTTRPWPSCALQQKKHMYAQISLDGFDSKGIETYVRNYFEEDHKADACLAKIRANGALNALAATPIVMSMLCFVMKVSSEDIGQIDTMSKIFESFLRAIFIKYIDKHSSQKQNGEGNAEASSEKDIKPKLEIFWNGLGEMALMAVNAQKKKIFFNEDEFTDDSVRVLGLKVGFLLRHKSKLTRMDALESPMTFYSFPHQLFQEKCAGDYLASHNGEFDKLVSSIENRNEAFALQYTLAFACGKGESVEYAIKVMNMLIHVKNNDRLTGRRLIGKSRRDDLEAKITEGLAGDVSSLFNLALLVNYESQSKGQLIQNIATIASQKIFQQLITGMFCSPFLYFINFALSERILLPSCQSLTLSQSGQPIFLQDYVMHIFTLYSSVTRVGIARCPLQLKAPEGYAGCSLEAKFDDPFTAHIDDKVACVSLPRNLDFSFWTEPRRKELLLQGIPHSVSFTDLSQAAGVITPGITEIILNNLSIVLPRSEDIKTGLSCRISSLVRLVLVNIENVVTFDDCLHLTALCPSLSSLEVYFCCLDRSQGTYELAVKNRCYPSPEMILLSHITNTISVPDILKSFESHHGVQCLKLLGCTLSFAFKEITEKSGRVPITDVFLTDSGYTSNISDCLKSFGPYCQNLTLTYHKDHAKAVVGPGDFQDTQQHCESSLERLELVCQGDSVSLPELLISTMSLCPSLKQMHLEGNVVNFSSLPDVINDKTSSLTSLFLKSVVEDIPSQELVYLVGLCSSLQRLFVDDCRLVNSPNAATCCGEKFKCSASREIAIVFFRTKIQTLVLDILKSVQRFEFKSCVLCLNNCIVNLSQSPTSAYGSQSGRPKCECGVLFEHCVPSDSSTSLQDFMSATCPFMHLEESGSTKQIYVTSGFNLDKSKIKTLALFSGYNVDSQASGVALGKNILDPEERSLLISLYYDQTMV